MRMMPAIMLALSVAKIVGDHIAPDSFDEAMMHLQGLPYLEEAPPRALGLLSAENAIASPVVVVPEVVNVGFLVQLLERCGHNGFPVVPIERNLVGAATTCEATVNRPKHRVIGMVLRRQLIVLLQRRVWEHELNELPEETRNDFIASFATRSQQASEHAERAKRHSVRVAVEVAEAQELAKESGKSEDAPALRRSMSSTNLLLAGLLQPSDLERMLDLKPFMDPAPLTVTTLMPLNHVYRLFNEIGVRHLPVLHAHGEHNGMLAGILTRKDLQADQMAKRMMKLYECATARAAE